MRRNKTTLSTQTKASVNIEQKLRNLLISGILLSSLLAVMLLNEDLEKFRIGMPQLEVSVSSQIARPGERVTYTFALSGLPRKTEGYVDFENHLMKDSGFEFVPGSLVIKSGDIGTATISGYPDNQFLSIKQIPGNNDPLVLSVDAVIPTDKSLVGKSIEHKSFFKFGGKKYISESTYNKSSILISQ